MKFVHVTDPHLMPPGERLFGFDTQARFDACLDDIARLHGDAAFCAVTGDLTEAGDAAAYAWLRDRLARFPAETRLLLGNCDDRARFLSVFGGADEAGFVQSELRAAAGTFLFLDTLGDGRSAEGRYDAPRLAWLEARLARAQGPVFLFMHHPPFDIGHRNDVIKLADHAAFAARLEGSGVRHIFFGHIHRPVGGQWRGIGFTGLPGLAFQIPLVETAVPAALSDEPPMYGVVTVGPDSVVTHFDAFLHRRPLDDGA